MIETGEGGLAGRDGKRVAEMLRGIAVMTNVFLSQKRGDVAEVKGVIVCALDGPAELRVPKSYKRVTRDGVTTEI